MLKNYEKLRFESPGFSPRPYSKDETEHARMQSDPAFYYQKHKLAVEPLPPQFVGLAKEALQEAYVFQTYILGALSLSEEQFFENFEKLRVAHNSRSPVTLDLLNFVPNHIKTMIPGLDWVGLFAWIMPAADPERAHDYKRAGSFFAALHYIKMIEKAIQTGVAENQLGLKRIEAVYQLARNGEWHD